MDVPEQIDGVGPAKVVPGAQLVVSVDGTEYRAVASGASVQLAVPPLDGRAVVRARQDAGSGFTPWSADVEVEDVLLPPATSPRLPEGVGACSQCVRVSGLAPGAHVELVLQSTGGVVGTGTADGAGTACVDVDLAANHTGDQVQRLNALRPAAGERHDEANMASIDR